MNTKEYIESGMLEQYVMGTLSAQEKQEVECMSHIYPEIAAELLSVQQTMEALAQSVSKTPPAHLREQILGSLHELSVAENSNSNSSISKNNQTQNESSSPLVTEPTSFKTTMTAQYNFMRIAASVLLLLSLGLAYQLYQQSLQQVQQQNQLTTIQQELNSKTALLSLHEQQLAVLQNPDFLKIDLNGIPAKSPDSKVLVYWNKKSNDVYLSIAKLPAPTENKQYQLWAIADGKPVDMGMLSENSTENIFQKMKTIANAQAFAITLEKKGGVQNPTMSEMYVMGGV